MSPGSASQTSPGALASRQGRVALTRSRCSRGRGRGRPPLGRTSAASAGAEMNSPRAPGGRSHRWTRAGRPAYVFSRDGQQPRRPRGPAVVRVKLSSKQRPVRVLPGPPQRKAAGRQWCAQSSSMSWPKAGGRRPMGRLPIRGARVPLLRSRPAPVRPPAQRQAQRVLRREGRVRGQRRAWACGPA